jgi:putative photosynthetic complex assembly protein 2
MRLSAKFNIFAGVPHLSTEMMPEHMRYLASYFRIGRARGVFVVSVIGIAVLAAWLGAAALRAEGGLATGYALAFALVVLAFIEHGFLVVPWQDTRLFRWAMRESATPVDTNQKDGPLGADSMTRRRPNPLAPLESAGQ